MQTRPKEEPKLYFVRVPKILTQRIIKEKVEMAVYNLLFGNSWKMEELKKELQEEKYQEMQKIRVYFRPKFNKPLQDIVNYPKNDYSIQDIINMAILFVHKDPIYQYEPFVIVKPLSTSTNNKNDLNK